MKKLAQLLCLCSVLSIAVSPWAAASPPTNPGQLWTCYKATVYLDFDCDGQWVGVYEGSASQTGCYALLAHKRTQAGINGYCYSEPTPNCLMYTSQTPCR